VRLGSRLGQVADCGVIASYALSHELQRIERDNDLNCPGVLVSVPADPVLAHAAAASNESRQATTPNLRPLTDMRIIFIKGRDEVKFVRLGIERHRSVYQALDVLKRSRRSFSCSARQRRRCCRNRLDVGPR
jgi:hypothetical protein